MYTVCTRNRFSSALFTAPLLFQGVVLPTGCVDSEQAVSEIRVFSVPEANQGVAVDEHYFYAIDNYEVGKYDKRTGERAGGWKGEKGGPIIHLNSGVVKDGKLYCGHSNYPGIPMQSSIEIWDTATMEHAGSHSFGLFDGSCTWIDFKDGFIWVAFVHYAEFVAEIGKDQRWTTLVKFDQSWQRLEAWVFPPEIIKKFAPSSNSGGAWGPDGRLYVTGHDLPELYVVKLPEAGSVLEHLETIEITSQGQGIAWDPYEPGILYSMRRKSLEILVTRVLPKE